MDKVEHGVIVSVGELNFQRVDHPQSWWKVLFGLPKEYHYNVTTTVAVKDVELEVGDKMHLMDRLMEFRVDGVITQGRRTYLVLCNNGTDASLKMHDLQGQQFEVERKKKLPLVGGRYKEISGYGRRDITFTGGPRL